MLSLIRYSARISRPNGTMTPLQQVSPFGQLPRDSTLKTVFSRSRAHKGLGNIQVNEQPRYWFHCLPTTPRHLSMNQQALATFSGPRLRGRGYGILGIARGNLQQDLRTQFSTWKVILSHSNFVPLQLFSDLGMLSLWLIFSVGVQVGQITIHQGRYPYRRDSHLASWNQKHTTQAVLCSNSWS